MTTKAVYVLESRWSWDNTNTEFATIVVEEPNRGFEDLFDSKRKDILIGRLLRIAGAQNSCPQSSEVHLMALYRVEWARSDLKWLRIFKDNSSRLLITMELVPVCSFDSENKPIPFEEKD